MRRTVTLAEEAGVAIGAHPSFPDLMGFGRRPMQASLAEVQNYVTYQVGALQAFTQAKRLQHVKAHGALYNMGEVDEELAGAVAEAVREVDPNLILVGLSGSAWIKAGPSSPVVFNSYLLEVSPEGRSQWETLRHSTSMVKEGMLRMWATAGLPVGRYRLRLTLYVDGDAGTAYPTDEYPAETTVLLSTSGGGGGGGGTCFISSLF